jgi:hypothetical protein
VAPHLNGVKYEESGSPLAVLASVASRQSASDDTLTVDRHTHLVKDTGQDWTQAKVVDQEMPDVEGEDDAEGEPDEDAEGDDDAYGEEDAEGESDSEYADPDMQ